MIKLLSHQLFLGGFCHPLVRRRWWRDAFLLWIVTWLRRHGKLSSRLSTRTPPTGASFRWSSLFLKGWFFEINNVRVKTVAQARTNIYNSFSTRWARSTNVHTNTVQAQSRRLELSLIKVASIHLRRCVSFTLLFNISKVERSCSLWEQLLSTFDHSLPVFNTFSTINTPRIVKLQIKWNLFFLKIACQEQLLLSLNASDSKTTKLIVRGRCFLVVFSFLFLVTKHQLASWAGPKRVVYIFAVTLQSATILWDKKHSHLTLEK